MISGDVEAAARILIASRSVCVSTGAGMSVESGLDTFRGDDGLWSKADVHEMATPEAFRRDPVKVWAWYRHRRQKLAQVEPHEGHRVLAEWETRTPDFTLVTQNIDGLHHRAGSRNVIELHGRLDSARCTCCDYKVRSLGDLGPEPTCPVCQKRLRPDVVWFGELLPPGVIEAAFAATQRCDVFLVIGTSGIVQPAAALIAVAKTYRANVIEINPNETDVSNLADVRIRSGCRAALAEIDVEWRKHAS